MSRLTYLLAELYLDGGLTLRRFATSSWYSSPEDSIGVRAFEGRITAEPTYSIQLGCVQWGRPSTTSFGSIELANTDGALRSLLQRESRDCRCVLRLVDEGQGYDESVIVADVIIDEIQQTEDTIRVLLRGQDTRLDRPLQSVLYADDVGNEQLVGTPMPITIGRCRQIEPAVINPVDLSYQVADCGVVSIGRVLSGGSEARPPSDPDPQWDYAANRTGFQVSVTPSARVTADVTGARLGLYDAFNVDANFYDPLDWTGDTPNGWTKSETPPVGTVTNISGVGARFIWGPASPVSMSATALPTSAAWVMLMGRVSRLSTTGASGMGVRLRAGGDVTWLSTEGEFCHVVYLPAGSNQQLIIESPSGSLGDAVIESLHVYPYSSSLPATVFHAAIECMFRGGLTPRNGGFLGELVPVDLQPLYARQVGYHQRDNTTARQAIEYILQAVSGWYFVAPDGRVRFGALRSPPVSSDIVANSTNIVDHPIYQLDTAPGLSDSYAAERNWSPYTDNELAGITHPDRPPFIAEYREIRTGTARLNRAYRHAIGATPIGTALVNATDAQSESDRMTGGYTTRTGFWTFPLAFRTPQAAAEVLPDRAILLDHQEFGGDDGKIATITAIDGQLGFNVVKVTARL